MSAERRAIPETHGPSSLWSGRERRGRFQSLSAAENDSVSVIRMKPTCDYASSLPKILQFAMLQIVCLPCGRRRCQVTPHDQL